MDRLAVSAFSSAAKRGEQLHFVSDRPAPERLAGLDDLGELMDRGALQLVPVEGTYRTLSDTAAQLAVFGQVLDRALAEGYTGICVVADYSQFAAGDDEAFGDWLTWEATAEAWEANHPVTGICYFDRKVVPSARLTDLVAIHPVVSTGFEKPNFQLFVDGDAVRVVGQVEGLSAEQLRRLLASSPNVPAVVLDLSGVEFIDHRSLLTLNQVANEGRVIRISGASPFIRRIWKLLDVATPRLGFC